MKTMDTLCKRFNSKHPYMHAELKDHGLSMKKYYRVDISRKGYAPTAFYFKSCKDFAYFCNTFGDKYNLIIA